MTVGKDFNGRVISLDLIELFLEPIESGAIVGGSHRQNTAKSWEGQDRENESEVTRGRGYRERKIFASHQIQLIRDVSNISRFSCSFGNRFYRHGRMCFNINRWTVECRVLSQSSNRFITVNGILSSNKQQWSEMRKSSLYYTVPLNFRLLLGEVNVHDECWVRTKEQLNEWSNWGRNSLLFSAYGS